jgi:hypothetical protein
VVHRSVTALNVGFWRELEAVGEYRAGWMGTFFEVAEDKMVIKIEKLDHSALTGYSPFYIFDMIIVKNRAFDFLFFHSDFSLRP